MRRRFRLDALAIVLVGHQERAVSAGGLDEVQRALDVVRRLAAQLGGRLEVCASDASQQPCETGSVDLVVRHQTLQHAKDPVRVLAESWRVFVRW
jgi:ubiquinone/menaquinone biosynthesis C-methylase UbiE